ncbi:hypothetical protein [Thiohalorhabdus methylotrophus]|uniref:Uncharacterized protein n=1 Tax=Thiohalorhabdus methylotrophus TaxID=3242694 RepID=A0ABV4TWN3_9GAMM
MRRGQVRQYLNRLAEEPEILPVRPDPGTIPVPLQCPAGGGQLAPATAIETAGARALLVGLATRYFPTAPMLLDVVAWYAVHAGQGYNVCDNGWKRGGSCWSCSCR